MRRERKLEGLRYSVDDEGWIKGDELTVYCKSPRGCNGSHHKRKLVIDLETDKFHCWVCGWGGRSLEPIFRLKRDSEFYREYSPPKEDEKKEHQYEQVVLPKEFKTLSEAPRDPWGRAAMGYLEARGVTSDDIKIYKIGYCDDGPYRNRIIFPSFDRNGALNFFVGRAFYESAEMKYKHGAFSKDIIFNEYLVDWRKPIILVEGIFDAIKVGTQAIPLLGTNLHSENLKRKILARASPVYVMLDSDARQHSFDIEDSLMRSGILCYHVDIGDHKDPGDMSREEIAQVMSKADPVRSLFDLMRLKLNFRSMMTGSVA